MAANSIIVPADITAFWTDETSNITGVRLKTDVPVIKPKEIKFPYVVGHHETLVFLALTLTKSRSKANSIRALASATGILLGSKKDMLGGKGSQITLDLDGEQFCSDREPTEIVGKDWDEDIEVTAGEIAKYVGDVDEIGAYFGVMFMAGVKKRNDRNRDAFNANRVGMVTSLVSDELCIFVPDSIFFADEVLDTMYTAFNSFLPNRMYLVQQTAALCAGVFDGPALAFQNAFFLLEDTGMGALKVIKEAVLKYPWIRYEFRDLKSELHAANQGQKAVRKLPVSDRPFCKAIYGSAFVPIRQTDINNLVGVCRLAMSFTVPSYANFAAGNISEKQEAHVRNKLESDGIIEAAEDVD
jgi:hypothetical protein